MVCKATLESKYDVKKSIQYFKIDKAVLQKKIKFLKAKLECSKTEICYLNLLKLKK